MDTYLCLKIVLSDGLSPLLQFLVLFCLLLQSSSLIPSQPVQLGVWSWLHEHWISPAFSGWPLLRCPTCSFVKARSWSSQRGSSRQVKHVFFLQFDWRLWSQWLFSSPNEQNWGQSLKNFQSILRRVRDINLSEGHSACLKAFQCDTNPAFFGHLSAH